MEKTLFLFGRREKFVSSFFPRIETHQAQTKDFRFFRFDRFYLIERSDRRIWNRSLKKKKKFSRKLFFVRRFLPSGATRRFFFLSREFSWSTRGFLSMISFMSKEKSGSKSIETERRTTFFRKRFHVTATRAKILFQYFSMFKLIKMNFRLFTAEQIDVASQRETKLLFFRRKKRARKVFWPISFNEPISADTNRQLIQIYREISDNRTWSKQISLYFYRRKKIEKPFQHEKKKWIQNFCISMWHWKLHADNWKFPLKNLKILESWKILFCLCRIRISRWGRDV